MPSGGAKDTENIRAKWPNSTEWDMVDVTINKYKQMQVVALCQYVYICMCIYMSICLYVYTSICLYVYMSICLYVCMSM